ncbi:MAG: DUF1572 family protein [Acidobacteriota bacterium]
MSEPATLDAQTILLAARDDLRTRFSKLKEQAESALAQIDDDMFFAESKRSTGGEGDLSIAVIVQHMAGNLRSRFTDFLTSDGEKTDRNRDGEFVPPPADRAALMARWDTGWAALFAAFDAVGDDRLGQTIVIRGESHRIFDAFLRQLAHHAYHVGQIVYLAKHARGADWQSMSIARGQSAAFEAAMRARFADDASAS